MPQHVIFSPDLPFSAEASRQTPSAQPPTEVESVNGADLSLTAAIHRHARFVYNRSNHNQRLAAKLLGISRSTLARYLRDMPNDAAIGSNSQPTGVRNEASVAVVSA